MNAEDLIQALGSRDLHRVEEEEKKEKEEEASSMYARM